MGRGLHHLIYLAVIIVLVIALVVVGARAAKAHSLLGEVRERFGVAMPASAAIPRAEPLREGEDLLREKTYAEYLAEVDGLIERARALGDFGDNARLAAACAHAVGGGKRLRPIIILELTRAMNLKKGAGQAETSKHAADAADAALFIEYLHAASLVIDDLPAFDDDNTRRGVEALHVKLDPATAQMAALSLVAGAYTNICRQVDWLRENCPELGNADRLGMCLCGEVSRAIGATGAAGGQHMDVAGGRTLEALVGEYGEEAVTDIMKKKTAAFYEIAFVAGWLVGGGDPGDLDEIRAAGQDFGTAFQIADDLGDMAQDARRQEAGKPGWNWALVFGAETAEREIARRLNACRLTLNRCGLFTPLWGEIYQKVWGMAAA